jgi:hypothetical protein
MSDSSNFGFAKLVPGFDFLQNLAKGATQSLPQMPQLASWVAPTLNVEELDKRIAELKAVQFWLEQNGRALGATIQALEVQKMTLATLQGMNFSMGELANALKLKTPGTDTESRAAAAPKPREAADAGAGQAAASEEAPRKKAAAESGKEAGNGAPVDPLQWWGALTQQFQQIAADAMKDVAQKTAADAARTKAARTKAAGAREAGKEKSGVRAEAPAAEPAAKPAKKPARKAAARKPRAKTTP